MSSPARPQPPKTAPQKPKNSTDAFARRQSTWRRERHKLDLDLEQAPLESRFSPQLADLMAREEAIVGEGCVDTPARKAAAEDLYRRVDDLLKLETRRYFESSTAHAHRRWSQLFQKQAREATKVREDLERKTRALLLKAGREDLPVKAEDDFAAQERLMRRKTAEQWRESARFDLREAFALQLARVDVEWEAYEHRLRLDVDEKLAELGSRAPPSPVQADSPTQRWKSKEKQELLVHTAPVLSPGQTPKLLSPGNRHDSTKVMSPDRMNARQEVENAFHDAMARVAFQKETARRWIRRQAGRMTAQVDCSEPVRRFLATRLYAAEEAEDITRLRCEAYDDVSRECALNTAEAREAVLSRETVAEVARPAGKGDPILVLPQARMTPPRAAQRPRRPGSRQKRVFAADRAPPVAGLGAAPVRFVKR